MLFTRNMQRVFAGSSELTTNPHQTDSGASPSATGLTAQTLPGETARHLLDAIPYPILLLDADGRVLDQNYAALTLAGCRAPDTQRQHLWTLPWWKAGEDRQVAIESALRGSSGDGAVIWHDEIEVQDPAGHAITLRALLRPVVARADQQSCFYFEGQFSDRGLPASALPPGGSSSRAHRSEQELSGYEAELKARETRLVEREQRFRAFVNASSDVVFLMNGDWSVMRRLDGRNLLSDVSEPIHDWLQQFIHPADHQHLRQTIRAAIDSASTISLEHRLRKADGTWGWFASRATPILDPSGTILEWFGAATDITLRHHADDAVAQQRRLYAGILDNTPDLAYIFDLQHRFIYANAGLLKMWGKSWDEAIGKNCLELGYEPWHAEMHDREIDQVIATKQPIRGEVPFAGTFGRRIYDYIFVPILGPNGQVEAVAGTTRDITEHREANQRKDEFLATLAHELRNPLAPIRNGLQILKLAENNARAIDSARAMMERQLEQMVHLIDDLLDLSRISRGKIHLVIEQVPLATAIWNAIETSRPIIDAAGHDLRLTIPADPILVEGDLTRLSQIFANLLNNAAKYTEASGVIQLSLESRGQHAVVTVRDNGIGIPEQMLSTVFDMFTQVDRSMEKMKGGLGIGLSIVKRLVEMHSGTIEARSDGPGQGSEFIVTLPLTTATVPSVAPLVPTPETLAAKTHSRRVLVVDDNRDSAISLAMLLRIMQHEVEVAHDGLQAIEKAEEFQPEMILLDIGMPRLNGYDAARRIRSTTWGRSTVLVAVTGWGQDHDKRQAIDAGFDTHMVKPIDPAQLEALLKHHFSTSD